MKCSSCGSLNPSDAQACMRCGAPTASTLGIQLGQIVGGYKIDAFVGEGAVGRVYRAMDVRLGRPVALKVMSNELLLHPMARARMEKEAKVLASVHHPNVVQIHDVLDYQGLPVLVLEFVAGGSLSDRIMNGRLGLSKALSLMAEILAGLTAIHAMRVVHRDIKPANILLSTNDELKIADLGIAHDAGSTRITKTGSHPGTPAYMSPEQVRGETIGPATDIYACGIVLYEMLTGHLPFDAGGEFDMHRAHVEGKPDLSRLPPGTPHHVIAAIARALEKAPNRRWTSALEFAAALKGSVTAQQPSAPPIAAISSLAITSIPAPTIPRIPLAPVRHTRIAPEPSPSTFPKVIAGIVLGGAVVFLMMRLSSQDASSSLGKTPGPTSTQTSAQTNTSPTTPKSLPTILPTNTAITTRLPTAAPAPAPAPTPTITPEPAPAPASKCPAGMAFIPAGSVGNIRVASFCMDITEVTTRAYAECHDRRECTEATTIWRPAFKNLDDDQQANAAAGEKKICNAVTRRWDHPVNCVNWDQAQQYCQWAGKRLPSENEWGYVALNPSKPTKYPWGDDDPSDDTVCWSGNNRRSATCAVTTGRRSVEFRLYGLAGNVWEWTSTEASGNTECSSRRINRGGSWGTPTSNIGAEAFEGGIRGSSGGCAQSAGTMIGFRCAVNPI